MAEILPSGLQQAQRAQVGLTAQGVLTENCAPAAFSAVSAPATQTVYGQVFGLLVGDVVTGVVLRSNTAAAGAAPTTARFGLCDSAGKMLVLSGNLAAAASWPIGGVQLAFTAPFTVLVQGGYYGVFVVNGVWGGTQPALVRGFNGAVAMTAVGANPPPTFQWTGQTDLPGIGASVTMVSGSNLAWYMGLY